MKYILYAALLLPLLLPFIVSGQFSGIALISILVISLVGLFTVSHFGPGIHKNKVNLLFAAFILVSVILVPFSLIPYTSINVLLWWLSYFIVFLVFQSLISDEKILLNISRMFVALTTGFGIVSALAFIHVGLTSYTRLDGIIGTHNIYGGFLILPLLLSIYLALRKSSGYERTTWIFCSGFILASIFLTFSRGTWLSLVLAIIIGIALFRDNLKVKALIPQIKNISILLIVAVVCASGIWIAARIHTAFLNQAQLQNAAVFSNEDPDNNAFVSRLHYFADAWSTFLHRPVTGYGLGSYANALRMNKTDPNYGSFGDPHNWILRMLVEDGIVQTFIFLIFLSAFLYDVYKQLRNREADWLSIVIFIGLIGSMVHGFMDFDWSINLFMAVFWAFAGSLYGCRKPDGEAYLPRSVTGIAMVAVLGAAIVSVQFFRADTARKDGDYFLYVRQDTNKAALSYLDSTDINSHDSATWFDLWRVSFFEKKYTFARDFLNKAIALFPENGLYYTAAAQTDEATKNYSTYHSDILNAIKYFPADNLDDYVRIVAYDLLNKNYSEASEYLKVIPIYDHYAAQLWFKNDPNSPEIAKNMLILKTLQVQINNLSAATSSKGRM